MSTSVIEPGARLAGRYRLEDRVREAGGSTLWRAIDEILARAVAVRTFDPDFARVGAVVTAARAASRLTDPRLTQVFDADDSGEQAYVVSEWVTGESLEQMIVANGPMDPGRAATLLSEAAEAIAAAHSAGLAHLRLTLRDLLWTTGGTVKVVGVAVDAELAGTSAADPALVDAQGLGHMLYAAVTGHWSGESSSELPAAPMAGSQICAPRQVKAGVPYALDALVCRVLRLPMQGAGVQEPINTPAALAQALTGVPRTPLPLFAGLNSGPPPSIIPRQPRDNGSAGGSASGPGGGAATQSRPPGTYGGAGHSPVHGGVPGTAQGPAGPGGRGSTPHPTSPAHRTGGAGPARSQPASFNAMGPGSAATQRSNLPEPGPHDGLEFGRATVGSRSRTGAGKPVNRPLVALAATLATIIVVIGAWQLTNGGGSSNSPGTQPSSAAVSPSKVSDKELKSESSEGFDADPSHNRDPTSERSGALATDDSTSTAWETQSYSSPEYGKLKDGLGVILDMGEPVTIGKVKLTMPTGSGGKLEVRVGDGKNLSELKKVATHDGLSDTFEISSDDKETKGRYLLLWVTELPSISAGRNKAKIQDVIVYGRQG